MSSDQSSEEMKVEAVTKTWKTDVHAAVKVMTYSHYEFALIILKYYLLLVTWNLN